MAFRSTSLRSNILGHDKENRILPGKEVRAKIVSGPTLRRAALGDIGNKAANRLPQQQNAKAKKDEAFKKPSVKTKVAPKAPKTVDENAGVKVEETVVADTKTNTTVAMQSMSEDMSVVEDVKLEQDKEVLELSDAFSSKLLTVVDIDAEDKDNPQLVSEYVNDIYAYMRSLEEKHLVPARYLDGHVINSRMRTILIDWLVQVHARFNLMQETLYLTVSILDRYLSLVPDTSKDELQLVGVTSMFIASKYEEMYCTEIGDFVYITDKSYTKQQIRRMEINMLRTLDYYISYPLPLHFLRRNSKAAMVDAAQHALAKYLMELCQPDYNMCHYKASEIGAAALCLSIKLIGENPEWTDTLVHYSGYSEEDIIPIVCKMAQCVTRSHTSKQQSVVHKYRSAKNLKVSELPELKGSLIRTLSEKAATIAQ